MSRIDVKKTYKLYINGAFPRSESGRVYEVKDAKGAFIANPALASRKDLRDAVVASRAAFAGWNKSTAYLKGQILYRVAEMLEGRRAQFEVELKATGDKTKISEAIDLIVWYAGWTDKLAALDGVTNPVSGPFYNFTTPEALGVVGIVSKPDFLEFIDSLMSVIASGNTAVIVAPDALAIPAMSFAEVLATSDVPAGVINILTGKVEELAPWMASHMDIDGLDITGAKKTAELKVAGAENLKRIHAFTKVKQPARILAFMEAKTIWHTVGI
ncbi:MAG: aldehyde dehydrogenase family protein [Candidatus Nanopelagicaceae bacterium]